MAVVQKYGTGAKDPSTYSAPNALYAEAFPRSINSSVAIANGDSANSTIVFGKVPSWGLIVPRSLLRHTAITGLTDFDLGFATVAGTAALADGLDLATAGTKSAVAAVTVPNLVKSVWELAGYTSDPGMMLDIIGTMKTAATAAGTINLELDYVVRG